MEILGLGNDIIEIDRIDQIIGKYGHKFLDRLFTKAEQAYCMKYRCPSINFAGRFAAKEAIVKALGTGIREGISWLDIEITNDALGKPCVSFSDRIPDRKILLTISHSKKYATAVAILVKT